MPEDEANKKPMSPAQKRAIARAEREHRDTQWGRLDAKLGTFSFEDNNKSEFISARITAPPDRNGAHNQYRNGGSTDNATMEWNMLEDSQRVRVPGRVSSSFCRIGAGSTARLVLFGGLEESGELASNQVECFDPLKMRWCTPSERGAVRGRPPAPRAGHTATSLGRHLVLLFGGRTEEGLSSELHALSQYKSKSEADGPASTLFWTKERTTGTQQPCARAHHASTSLDSTLYMFGGEVLMRSDDRDELLGLLTIKAQAPGKASASAKLSDPPSATLPMLSLMERTDVQGARPFDEMVGCRAPSPGRRSPPSPTRARAPSKVVSHALPAAARSPQRPQTTPAKPQPHLMPPGSPHSTLTLTPSGSAGKLLGAVLSAGSQRRPHSPADALMYLELARLSTSGTDPGARAYRVPAGAARELELQQMAGMGEDALMLRRTPAARSRPRNTPAKWVHFPLNDLWKLSIGPKGLLEWAELSTTGSAPFPRSRHVFEAVGARKLALLFGGRSVHASVALGDLYALDLVELVWARLEMCGVPPSPRESCGAAVLGTSLILFGGRGRTCHHDTALFHLKPDTRTGMLTAPHVLESAGYWQHPRGEHPNRRQEAAMVGTGTATLLCFGGCGEVGAFDTAGPLAGTFTAGGYGVGYSIASLSVKPAADVEGTPPEVAAARAAARAARAAMSARPRPEATVGGGAELTLHGRGFKDGYKIFVRFSTPHLPPPPPPPPATSGMPLPPPPLCLPSTELCKVVLATYVSSSKVACTVPDMADFLCDGSVLVEAYVDEGHSEEAWTVDETELILTSEVDTSRLRLKGPTAGLVGTQYTLVLHTFDQRGRRRATGGDAFTCALRSPGNLEEGAEPNLLTPEEAASDLANGTHELRYYYERAGSCLFIVRLGGRIVKEVGVTLEAGPTDAKATELLMVPPPKGNDVLISAGGTISFNLQPKDRFGNSSELREDAKAKHFTWRLQRVQLKTKPPDDDDDDFPLYPKPVPIEEGATHSFTSLSGTSVGVTVAGDYDLTVQHDGLTVKGKPVRIKVEPDALSPPHITMHGSGLHDAYVDWDKPVDRFVLLTGRDAYSNWMGKMVPNFRESIHVTLRNQDKDGTNPMVELSDVGEGVLRLTYGVRMHGQFVLSIAFGSTLLLAKKITIGRIADRPADCPPDSFELWMTQFSLQAELDRLEAVAREEARQKEEARLAAEKAEDERLFAEWGATVTPTLVKAAVPTAVIAAIQAHHRKLRDLHASFSAPTEGPPAAGAPPKLNRRAWNLLTRFSKLVERPEGMGRRTLSALYEELTSGVTEKAGGAFSLTALPPSGDGSDKDGLGLARFGLALARLAAPVYLGMDGIADGTPIVLSDDDVAKANRKYNTELAMAAMAAATAEQAAAPAEEEAAPADETPPPSAPAEGDESAVLGDESAPAPAPETAPEAAPAPAPAASDADPFAAWYANTRSVLARLVNCPLLEQVQADEDEDEEEAPPTLYELPPPWTPNDGAWKAILTHDKVLRELFAKASAPTRPPPSAEMSAEQSTEAAVRMGVARIGDAVTELGKLKGMYSEPLSKEIAIVLFTRAQPDFERGLTHEGMSAQELAVLQELVVDYDDFLTFLWLLLKAKFGPKSGEGFGAKVKEYLGGCPELVPPAPVTAPEPVVEEAPKKKKK